MTDQVAPHRTRIDDYDQERLLTAIAGLTDELSRASSRDEVLSLAATWVPNIVPADRASITFPVDADHLSVHALEGNKAIPMGVSLPIKGTTTGTAFRQLETVLIKDTSKRSEIDSKMLAGKGLVTCINAPLVSQGRAIGTLNVAHWKSGVYTQKYVELLTHVAGVLAAQLNLLDRFFATQEKLEGMVADRTRELETQSVRLQKALEKEKELNGLQRQFVSMVSHEFRTPLAIIDGVAQRLIRRLDGVAPDRLKDGLHKIRTSVARLIDLMESVLSVSRLESGTIRFEPRPCSIIEMVRDVCSNHQELSGTYQIISDLEDLPQNVSLDASLIRQVVSNLISNAIKYSPEGTRVWVNGETTSEGNVLISVRDEGPGIPTAELERLFDRFFRGSSSIGIIGTGIGLHIVRHFVEMHDGRVEVRSTEGEGTTFTVLLPSSAAATIPMEAA